MPETVKRHRVPLCSDPLLLELPEHILRATYDAAIRKVFRKYGSWHDLAFALDLAHPGIWPKTAHESNAKWLERACLDRRLPLPYACLLVGLMQGSVTLIDFYPYLPDYLET